MAVKVFYSFFKKIQSVVPTFSFTDGGIGRLEVTKAQCSHFFKNYITSSSIGLAPGLRIRWRSVVFFMIQFWWMMAQIEWHLIKEVPSWRHQSCCSKNDDITESLSSSLGLSIRGLRRRKEQTQKGRMTIKAKQQGWKLKRWIKKSESKKAKTKRTNDCNSMFFVATQCFWCKSFWRINKSETERN